MEYGVYYVDAWGSPLGHGTAADPRWCTLEGVAKVNSGPAPYAVANEFICGRLAMMLGLPAPPGLIVPADGGGHAYVALRFGLKGERPPPGAANDLVADYPGLAHGIVVFDAWIANFDRHAGNFAYSRNHIPPTLFDHERALLGETAGKAIERLETRKADASVAQQCLPPLLNSSAHIRKWTTRIGSIDASLIEELCLTTVVTGGATKEEAATAADFLCARQKDLYEIIKQAAALMPHVQNW